MSENSGQSKGRKGIQTSRTQPLDHTIVSTRCITESLDRMLAQ